MGKEDMVRTYNGIQSPGGSDGKESAAMQETWGDLGSITKSGRFPGEGNVYPLQDSCLENLMDRGACQATGHGISESDMTEVS